MGSSNCKKMSVKLEERSVKSREKDYYHYSITPKLELLRFSVNI
jgi:hypothetical protein